MDWIEVCTGPTWTIPFVICNAIGHSVMEARNRQRDRGHHPTTDFDVSSVSNAKAVSNLILVDSQGRSQTEIEKAGRLASAGEVILQNDFVNDLVS